jgi:outer membrane protein assembly factor BamB
MAGFDLGHTRAVEEAYPPLRGQQLWSTNLGSMFLTGPVVADDLAYVITGEGDLLAVDRTSGRIRWQRDVEAPADSPAAIAGETLFVGLRNRDLLALNKNTGEVLWTYRAEGPIVSSPVVVRGVVYVGSSTDAMVAAVDAASGEELWRTELNERQLNAAVSWDDNHMVVAPGNKVIYYDRRSRDRAFTFDSPFGQIAGTPLVIDDTVYVGLNTGGIIALAIEATNARWEKPIRRVWGQLWIWGMAPQPPRPSGFLWGHGVDGAMLASMAAKDDLLYYGTSRGEVTALNRNTREVAWTFEGVGAVRGAPAVVGDTLYIAAGPIVYALEAATGRKLWELQVAGDITSDIVVTKEALYVVDDKSNLYAIN